MHVISSKTTHSVRTILIINAMDVSELLKSIDIVEYISQFVELTAKNGEYWGLSPFKEEKTPSFSVRRETNKFFDFSSGFGGSLIAFVQRYFHVSAAEAIDRLANYAGFDAQSIEGHAELAATDVCRRFTKPKPEEKTCTASVLPENCMDKYEKRPEKLAVWMREGISEGSLNRFQVRYDAFADRLVYPIRNPDGKIVNIGGRTLDPEWKQKKLRKYCYYYSWGTIKTIYGLAENMEYCQQKHEIILFEGCKSVLLADTWGIKNAGAILTSHLSVSQMKLLAQLGFNVVFALDKDVNIRDDRNISKLKQFVNVSYIKDVHDLLEAKDSPADKGKDTFETLYDQRFKLR